MNVNHDYNATEKELEARFYQRGTPISFAEFIAYRVVRDASDLLVSGLQTEFDDAQSRVIDLEEELQTLKVKVWDAYRALENLDTTSAKNIAGREVLNKKLVEIAGQLEEAAR